MLASEHFAGLVRAVVIAAVDGRIEQGSIETDWLPQSRREICGTGMIGLRIRKLAILAAVLVLCKQHLAAAWGEGEGSSNGEYWGGSSQLIGYGVGTSQTGGNGGTTPTTPSGGGKTPGAGNAGGGTVTSLQGNFGNPRGTSWTDAVMSTRAI